jgi:soluble lytic murein transglycosylase-like protein
MHCSRLQTVAPFFYKHRDLLLFPARLQRGIGRSIPVLAVVMLLSLTAGASARAQAELALATKSETELAARPFADYDAEAAKRFGVPALWINAVMGQESGGDVRAVSSQGAMGLMQIMPDTWDDLRSRHGLGVDPFDPRDNILAGAAYLREMHDRYGSPGFLAAYNAGPKRYDEYLAMARELPVETELYVAALVPIVGPRQVDGMMTMAPRETSWQESALFAARNPHGVVAGLSPFAPSDRGSGGKSAAGQFALQPRPDGLFVSRASAKPLQ